LGAGAASACIGTMANAVASRESPIDEHILQLKLFISNFLKLFQLL